MIRERKLSMKAKLTLSLSAIAITLLVSSFISIMEYSRMSSYVSDLIADNVRSINSAQKLSELSAQYNHDLLAVIGDDISGTLPDFRQEEFMSQCDSLKQSLIDVKMHLHETFLHLSRSLDARGDVRILSFGVEPSEETSQ